MIKRKQFLIKCSLDHSHILHTNTPYIIEKTDRSVYNTSIIHVFNIFIEHWKILNHDTMSRYYVIYVRHKFVSKLVVI